MQQQAQWKSLAAAFNFPCEEPKRSATHWDYVLREAQWLAEDFMQVGTHRCFHHAGTESTNTLHFNRATTGIGLPRDGHGACGERWKSIPAAGKGGITAAA